jgi:hypothetical protein
MSNFFEFYPSRRRGLLFHGVMILVLGAASVLLFVLGLDPQSGLPVRTGGLLLMMLSLVLFAPLVWLAYRAYSLARASYRLERDGLRLRWGLRAEDIPLPEVEWVRRSTDLAASLPLPALRWPGALLGTVNAADLGPVEYLASSAENLVLIATPRRIYAVSPENPEAFLRAFQKTLELGSLSPLEPASVLPAAYLAQIWSEKAPRSLLLVGFALNLLLLVGVSLLISRASGLTTGEEGSALLLLPILGAFTYVVDLAVGMFFYRHENQRPIAYLVWASSALTGILLIAAVLMSLTPSL